MRILSQTGIVDLPYERIGISRNDTEIVATPIADSNPQERYWALAEYSTEAKARKVMEMLRGAHISHTQFKIMTEVQRSVFLSSVSEKEQDNLYGLFQFPTDDEVEA